MEFVVQTSLRFLATAQVTSLSIPINTVIDHRRIFFVVLVLSSTFVGLVPQLAHMSAHRNQSRIVQFYAPRWSLFRTVDPLPVMPMGAS